MNTKFLILLLFVLPLVLRSQQEAKNPVIHADVPDLSMIRVGDTYYMSSTTMHLSPGLPIMKSKDLVNWSILNYAYETLEDVDALNLKNGKSAYGGGSWASSLRYHDGMYYVTTFSGTTGKTYIFKTPDIESGNWERLAFEPSLHDNTLFFDKEKVWMIYGGGTLKMVELEPDLSGIKRETEFTLIDNASSPAGNDIGLPAEGSQLFKHNGYFYLFNIVWPRNGMRTVLVHRSKEITGPYEGKLVLQDQGVAQGGLIDTPQGSWYAYLFKDNGAVGRIPYLVPVQWVEDWPVLGVKGKVPDRLDLPANESLIPALVASDEFNREAGDESLPLVWQWNHNPLSEYWSLKARPGYLRLTTDRLDSTLVETRNTLTQRTIGPDCTGITRVDISGMKSGDIAGLALLQKIYGYVGIEIGSESNAISMKGIKEGRLEEVERITFSGKILDLKIVCDFRNEKDEATFYYRAPGDSWKKIGDTLSMEYTLPHFMGYRFGLFSLAREQVGGFADFDFFRIMQE